MGAATQGTTSQSFQSAPHPGTVRRVASGLAPLGSSGLPRVTRRFRGIECHGRTSRCGTRGKAAGRPRVWRHNRPRTQSSGSMCDELSCRVIGGPERQCFSSRRRSDAAKHSDLPRGAVAQWGRRTPGVMRDRVGAPARLQDGCGPRACPRGRVRSPAHRTLRLIRGPAIAPARGRPAAFHLVFTETFCRGIRCRGTDA